MGQFSSFDDIRQRIAASNANAATNRNLYPIQEQATLKEIWETVPCECEIGCTCKRLGCTHHWKLKADLGFSDILPAFIRMFVDKMYHTRLMQWFSGDERLPSSVPSRIEGAVMVLDNVRQNWDLLNMKASTCHSTLVCDNWVDDFWKRKWMFDVRGASVYNAKQFCLLLPDTGIPFDNASRNQILNFFHGNVLSYLDLLSKLRSAVVNALESAQHSLPEFRRLDSPHEQLTFDRWSIALTRKDFDYGIGYTPRERPLSRIIDKYFYRPSKEKSSGNEAHQAQIRSGKQVLVPLSGDGKPIECQIYDGGRRVVWGTTRFDLPDEVMESILDDFFVDSDKWYTLGASMTKPATDGLGEFVSSRFHRFSPRHASAIAAIMAQDNLIEYRGKKPIELRKVSADL